MPWIPRSTSGDQPARYAVPPWLYCHDDDQLVYAKRQRKETGQLREEILSYQKECGRQKDIEGARFFKEIAADLLKRYRGWDAAISWIMGEPGMDSWRNEMVSEPIAPYVDQAFDFIDLN